MPIFSRFWRFLAPQRRTNLPRQPLPKPSQQLVQPQIQLQAPRAHDCVPQPWHEFISHRWVAVGSPARSDSSVEHAAEKGAKSPDMKPRENQRLRLVTWNVDAGSLRPRARIAALLSHIHTLSPAVDVIFLQEVSRLALEVIMQDTRIQEGWFSTDTDGTRWSRQPFGTITLLSRTRFHQAGHGNQMTLGRVWRIRYDSRYSRDALCCDIHVHEGSSVPRCIRLVNVHLDSLAHRPSHRPTQMAAVASALREAGCGVVAGDFNPVLPEDQTLVADNGLLDAWVEVHGSTDGFTWGADQKRSHGPRRLDKVAMTGLQAEEVDVLRPGVISSHPMGWDP